MRRAWVALLAAAWVTLTSLPCESVGPASGPRLPDVVKDAKDRGAIWEIIQFLRAEDPALVLAAAWTLAEIGDDACVPILEAGPALALETQTELVTSRMRAAAEMLRLRLTRGAQALEGLAKLLHSDDPDIVAHAAHLLAASDHPEAAGRLAREYANVQDKWSPNAMAMALSLSNTNAPQALGAVEDLLHVAYSTHDILADRQIRMLEEAYWDTKTRGMQQERRIAVLIEGLRKDNLHNVMRMLVREGEDAVPALLAVVEDQDATEAARIAASHALGAAEEGRVVEALAEVLADREQPVQVRRSCAATLGAVGGKGAKSALLAAVQPPYDDPQVIRGAIRGLSWLRDPTTEGSLIRLLDHPDPLVRLSAVDALSRLGGDKFLVAAAGRLEAEDDDAVRFALGTVLARGSRGWSTDDALRMLRFEWPEVRSEAAKFLARLPAEDEHVQALLTQIGEETDKDAMEAEVRAFLGLRRAEATAELRALLDTVTEQKVRSALAAALQKPDRGPMTEATRLRARASLDAVEYARDRGATWELAQLLRASDPTVVLAATWALVEVGDETCVPLLEAGPGPALQGQRELVERRMQAAATMLRLRLQGGTEAVQGLAELAESDDPEIAAHAAAFIAASDAPEAIAQLAATCAGLKRRQAPAWRAVACELAQTKDPQALPAVEDLLSIGEHSRDVLTLEELTMLQEAYWDIETRGLEPAHKVAVLIEAVRNGNLHNARHALALTGAPAIPALLDLLKDGEAGDQSRQHAAWDLGIMKAKEAVDALAAVVADPAAAVSLRRTCATALGRIGSGRAVPALLSALEMPDGDPLLLSTVLDALHAIGDSASEEPVIPFLDHPDPVVRVRAAAALNGIGTGRYLDAAATRLEDEQDENARFALGMLVALSSEYWSAEDATEFLGSSSARVRAEAAKFLAGQPPKEEHIKALLTQIRQETSDEAMYAEVAAFVTLREAEALQELERIAADLNEPGVRGPLQESITKLEEEHARRDQRQ